MSIHKKGLFSIHSNECVTLTEQKSRHINKDIQPVRSVIHIARHRRRVLTTMAVLLGSVLLLSACNPITSQNIKLSSAAATGTGAGMMRPMNGMRDAGMRELANPDLIARVVAVDGNKVKVELMESSTSKTDASTRNTDKSTTDKTTTDKTSTDKAATDKTATNQGAAGLPDATGIEKGTGTSANGSDYTATGERKTITLSDEVQISEMSTLMERSGRGGGMDRNAGGTGGGNWMGAGSRSDTPNTGAGQQGNATDPAGNGAGGMNGNGNPAMPGNPTGAGSTPGDRSASDPTTRERGTGGDTATTQAELQAGDIVMIWYEEGEAIAKHIVILPMQ